MINRESVDLPFKEQLSKNKLLILFTLIIFIIITSLTFLLPINANIRYTNSWLGFGLSILLIITIIPIIVFIYLIRRIESIGPTVLILFISVHVTYFFSYYNITQPIIQWVSNFGNILGILLYFSLYLLFILAFFNSLIAEGENKTIKKAEIFLLDIFSFIAILFSGLLLVNSGILTKNNPDSIELMISFLTGLYFLILGFLVKSKSYGFKLKN